MHDVLFKDTQETTESVEMSLITPGVVEEEVETEEEVDCSAPDMSFGQCGWTTCVEKIPNDCSYVKTMVGMTGKNEYA